MTWGHHNPAAAVAVPPAAERPEDEKQRIREAIAGLQRDFGEEPQRCPHGETGPHVVHEWDGQQNGSWVAITTFTGELVRCPGPSGTATPEGERP